MRFSAVLASLLAIGLVHPAASQTSPAPLTPPAAQDQAPPAPLLCTVTTANICAGQGCTKAEALGDLKLPAKLLIHPEHRVLASTSADGFPHISQIMSLAATGKDHVLQGVDHATGWMIHLDEAGTKMTIAISSNEKILTGAGSCKKPGQLG